MKEYSAPIPKKFLPYASVTLARVVHSRMLITHASVMDEIAIYVCGDEDGRFFWGINFIAYGVVENFKGLDRFILASDALRDFTKRVEVIYGAYPLIYFEDMAIFDVIATLQDAIENDKPTATWALDLLNESEAQ